MDEIRGKFGQSTQGLSTQGNSTKTTSLIPAPLAPKSLQQSIEFSVPTSEELPLDRGLGIDEARRKRLAKAQSTKAAVGFESMMVHEVFKSMWSSVDKTNLFGENSNESQIYQDMMIQAVSDETAKGRGVGIKAYLQREMDRSELANNPKKGK